MGQGSERECVEASFTMINDFYTDVKAVLLFPGELSRDLISQKVWVK